MRRYRRMYVFALVQTPMVCAAGQGQVHTTPGSGWWYAIVALIALVAGAAVYRERVKGMTIRQAELLRQVAERTRELAEANERLALANKELQRLSFLDPLTSVANRRHFDQVLAIERQRNRRVGLPLSLILLDIDFFKHFNDSYGHQRGDECLKQVATIISGLVHRAGELVARYGGEEFVVVLPAADATTALALAQKLRTEVEAAGIPHPTSPFERLTISVGVSTAPGSVDISAESLIEAADFALYRAKREGRNRVVSADQPKATGA